MKKHWITAMVVAVVAGLLLYHSLKRGPDHAGARRDNSAASTNPSGPPASSAQALEEELIQANAGQQTDAALGREYQEINAGHFSGKLPAIPVLWEPRLRTIGQQVAVGFTEKGLWGHHGDATLILLNPDINADPAEVRRTLCHEMIHEYLFTLGESPTKHGAPFQNELQRLLTEGAFEGISASEQERADLKSRLTAEAARLDQDKSDLDAAREGLDRDARELNQQMSDLNQRIANASRQGSGGASQDEINAANARREDFNGRVTALNLRAQQHNADVAAFNQQVSRYNLMISYPDGLDEEAAIPSKAAAEPLPSRP